MVNYHYTCGRQPPVDNRLSSSTGSRHLYCDIPCRMCSGLFCIRRCLNTNTQSYMSPESLVLPRIKIVPGDDPAADSQRFQGFHSKQLLFICLLAMQIMAILTELPGVAREKRQPVQEIMTPCTTQSSFGRAVPKATTTSCARNHVPMSVSRSACSV